MRCLIPLLAAVALLSCGSSDGACDDDFDCDGTMVCNISSGECEPARCRQDADCVSPLYACVDNECLARKAGGRCRADEDCIEGEVCNLVSLLCNPG